MKGIDLDKIAFKQKKEYETKQEQSSFSLNFLNKDIHLFSNKFNDKKKLNFYNDLHILLSSGIDIKTALELICDDITKKEDKRIVSKITDHVIKGQSLSASMKQSGVFSPYEYLSIKIGEESGKIVVVLKDLSTYFGNKIEQKKKIINASSYPLIVLITAIVAVGFMLAFIVPMFEDIFKRFNHDLPYLTKVIINASDMLSRYFYLMVLIIAGLIILFYLVKKKETYNRIKSRFLLKIPFFGGMIRKIYMARFCLSMGLLVGSKVPLLNAIQLLKKMISFYPIAYSLEKIEKEILQGKLLHESMSQFRIYDKRMISLIKVAEEVNQLDIIFEKLQKQYSEDVQHQTGLISNFLEPVMILFIGLFVGIILIAMYLPMFQLSNSVAF